MSEVWLGEVAWDSQGLVPVIAQESGSGRLLMMAWMNRDALQETVASGRAVYWSRSRNKLWRKGEESGHVQWVRDIRLDCDGDAVLLEVEQVGGIACHTGRGRCFYRSLRNGAWEETETVVRNPEEIYRTQS
ncbi:MAG: phosphoribosyl-AMP cyclohydrolase [Burkholderiales bacterium]